MVVSFNVLWLGTLLLFLAILCLAPLMSVRVFWALIMLVIIVGLALTIVSMVVKRRERKQDMNDQTILLEYLKSHGLSGNLVELAESLGFTEEKTLKLLLSLEEQGAIPAGSSKGLVASLPDVGKI